MEYIFTYLILLIIILSAIVFPKSKFVKVIVLFMIFSLFCFSQDSGDYWIYLLNYDRIGSGGVSTYEAMFVLSAKIGNKLGLTYNQYRMILTIVEIAAINYVLKKQTKYATFVWALYLVHSAMVDAFLLRHFMGMVFILTALPLIRKKEEKKNILLYLGFVILAGLSHSAYWIFLLFLPLSYVSNTKKMVIIGMVALFIYGLSVSDLVFRLYALLPVRAYTISKYNTGNFANLNGIIFEWLMQFIYALPALAIWYSWKINKKKKGGCTGDHTDRMRGKLVHDMVSINVLFCLVIPFQFFAVNFSRMQRILAFINYIYLANFMGLFPMKRKITKLGAVAYAGLLLLMSMFVTSSTNIELVWNVHFKTNSVLNFLRW